jgi:hypothetical protein
MASSVASRPELQPEIHSSRPFWMFRHDFDGIQILSVSFDLPQFLHCLKPEMGALPVCFAPLGGYDKANPPSAREQSERRVGSNIAGRQKEMSISGGENVCPAEIEQVLLSHPEVQDAASSVFLIRNGVRWALPTLLRENKAESLLK